AFVLADRRLMERPRWYTPWLVAAAWAATELARGRLLTGSPVFIGNPWGLLGYSQADLPALTQITAVTRIYGVSFAIAAVNAAIAEWWTGRRSGLVMASGLAPAAAVLLFGVVTLDRAVEGGVPTPVALVQANLSLGATWRPGLYGRNLDVYLDES